MIHKAKKSLGQNFLKSDSILKKIVDAGEIKKDDVVLEIGPGKGALTAKLLGSTGKVIAVEKDNHLFAMLQEKFATEIKFGSLVLVHDDILKFDISSEILKFLRVRQDLTQYKIIANIPYNITGAILKKFLTEENQPECMVLMVQHEVAQRILARDSKESILSISVKAYGEPKMIAKIDKRFFSPPPKVNSAVIKIDKISRKLFTDTSRASMDGARHDIAISEEKFWEIVKKGFAHKRKKLSGNLKGVVSAENSDFVKFKDKRAEDLSLKEWIAISNMV